jgi:hypothetical protein
VIRVVQAPTTTVPSTTTFALATTTTAISTTTTTEAPPTTELPPTTLPPYGAAIDGGLMQFDGLSHDADGTITARITLCSTTDAALFIEASSQHFLLQGHHPLDSSGHDGGVEEADVSISVPSHGCRVASIHFATWNGTTDGTPQYFTFIGGYNGHNDLNWTLS